MSRLIRIALACNDEHGAPAGKLRALEVAGGGVLSIDSLISGAEMLCSFDGHRPGTLRLGRRRFCVQAYQPHYGNIMWDAFGLEPEVAERLLNHVLGQRWRGAWKYGPDGGWATWFERARRRQPFTAAFMVRSLRDLGR